MKICFPTMGRAGLDETIGRIFDRVWTYTIVDTGTSETEIIPMGDFGRCGSENIPRVLALKGVKAFLVLNMTPDLRSRFEDEGIKVYMGANGTVRRALGQFHSGRLVRDCEDTNKGGFDLSHPENHDISQLSG